MTLHKTSKSGVFAFRNPGELPSRRALYGMCQFPTMCPLFIHYYFTIEILELLLEVTDVEWWRLWGVRTRWFGEAAGAPAGSVDLNTIENVGLAKEVGVRERVHRGRCREVGRGRHIRTVGTR